MPRPQPSPGRYLAASLFAAAIACRTVAFAWAGGATMALASEVDWVAASAAAFARTVHAWIVVRLYWYRFRFILHLPPKLQEREMVRLGESKFVGDLIAGFVEGLRRYAERAA